MVSEIKHKEWSENDVAACCLELVERLERKKADNILVYDVRSLSTGLGDFFVLATGNSSVHINALYEETVDHFESLGVHVTQEGKESSRWKLVDGGDIVVHIFTPQGRDFYGLERIWGDGEIFYKSAVEE